MKQLATILLLVLSTAINSQTTNYYDFVYTSNVYTEGISSNSGYGYATSQDFAVTEIKVSDKEISVQSEKFFWIDTVLLAKDEIVLINNMVFKKEYICPNGRYILYRTTNEILSFEYIPFNGICINFTRIEN